MSLRKFLRKAIGKKAKGLTTKAQFILEVIASSENMKAEYNKARQIIENGGQPGHGFVTVVVNKGKPNERLVQEDIENLLTTSGRDFFHAQCYTNTSAGTRGSNFIAVSNEATNPLAGDTSLAGEITSGGLSRTVASTISHTGGTNTTTLEEEFTASSVFSDIHKSALFNAAGPPVAGQMTHAAAFAADVDLQVSDTLTITWTVTMG